MGGGGGEGEKKTKKKKKGRKIALLSLYLLYLYMFENPRAGHCPSLPTPMYATAPHHSFNAEYQAGKLWIPTFWVFWSDSTRKTEWVRKVAATVKGWYSALEVLNDFCIFFSKRLAFLTQFTYILTNFSLMFFNAGQMLQVVRRSL